MNDEQSEKRALNALESHTKELSAMEQAVKVATEAKAPIPNFKEIYMEIANAASECASTLDFYNEKKGLPKEVNDALASVLDEITNISTGLLTYFDKRDPA